MPNHSSRLAKIEAQLAALQAHQTQQDDRAVTASFQAKYAAMPDEELLRLYHEVKPITDPKLAADLAALEGISTNELIQLYTQKIRG